MGMANQAKITYKRVGRNNVEITYKDGQDTTVVVAKTVKRGSYTTCDRKSAVAGNAPAAPVSRER